MLSSQIGIELNLKIYVLQKFLSFSTIPPPKSQNPGYGTDKNIEKEFFYY